MMKIFKNFWSDRSGVTLVEGLISIPIVFFTLGLSIELIFGVFQLNAAAKAMQLAARRVIVSTPFTTDFQTVIADPVNADSDGNQGGIIPPNGTVISSCGAGTGTACIPEALDYLVGPHPDNSVWPGLSGFFFNFDEDTIRVTYEQNGLGFFGRPAGPVVTVRLELENAIFLNLPFTGTLLSIGNVTLPPFTVSATTEDLSSCPSDLSCPWGGGNNGGGNNGGGNNGGGNNA